MCPYEYILSFNDILSYETTVTGGDQWHLKNAVKLRSVITKLDVFSLLKPKQNITVFLTYSSRLNIIFCLPYINAQVVKRKNWSTTILV